jgi:TatD DNase family protein
MIFIDTHTHLYLEEFDTDRDDMIERAINNNVKYMLLPNIDNSSIKGLFELCSKYPENCFPMLGLHPTSVKENFKDEIREIEKKFVDKKYYAIGETGIDLYWDKTFKKEQEEAFRLQIEMAIQQNLPIVIHSRESFEEIFGILEDYRNKELCGVFHCFTGTLDQANHIIGLGLKLGIGGVVTFKNSGLGNIISKIELANIILETDSPYLTPAPFRGKRNESAYIKMIAQKISEVKNIPLKKVAEITTSNAIELFKLSVK